MYKIEIDGPKTLECDVLVIGSGAGGSAVANTLAKAGVNVLIVEEGPEINPNHPPAGLSLSMQEIWRNGGLTSTLGTQIAYAEGRCVGGGTEINSAIFQSAPGEILDEWRASNNIDNFSVAEMNQYYKRAIAAVHASEVVADDTAGANLRQAAKLMGWRFERVNRAVKNCVGTNMCASACPTGAKQSMSNSVLPEAFAFGAHLISDTKITTIIHKNRRAVRAIGFYHDESGMKHKLEIKMQFVFLCAGAIHTPFLLQKSGLGRHCGKQLQVHPTVKVLAKFKEKVNAHNTHLPSVAVTEFMPHARFGGSVFTVPTFGMSLAEDWSVRKNWLQDYEYYAIYYAMIKPDGVGSVKALPGLKEPVVAYKLTARDWRRIENSLNLLAKSLFLSGAEKVVPSITGHAGWEDENQLVPDHPLHRNKINLMTIHLFGSCPMGEGVNSYPVNSYGRLTQCDNLVVADASVLPGAPGVNPQATIMALAYRFVDYYLNKHH